MENMGKQIKMQGDMWWRDESTKRAVIEFSYYGDNFSFKVPSPKHSGGMFEGRCTKREGGEYQGQIRLIYRGQEIKGHASCHIAESDAGIDLHGVFTLDDGNEQLWHARLQKIR